MTNPNDSFVGTRNGVATSFVGPDAVNLYRAAHLASALRMFAKTGMLPTRGVSGSRLLAMATEYSGKHYKRGTHAQAAEDVSVWIETMKAALSYVEAPKLPDEMDAFLGGEKP